MPNEADLRFYSAFAAKLTGAFSGVATRLVTDNDFLGAGAGTVVAIALEAIGNEVISGVMAERPKVRVARTVSVARRFLADRILSGHELRTDGFVQRVEGARSPAEEVTEAALQIAMRSPQERKVDLIGYMLAYIATDPAIGIDDAHLMMNMADQLTFRSITLLAIAARNRERLMEPRPLRGTLPPSGLHALMVDAYGLFRQGLVEFADGPDGEDTYLVPGAEQIDGGRMRLTATGRMLADGLGLEFIDDQEATYSSTLEGLRALSAFALNSTVADAGPF